MRVMEVKDSTLLDETITFWQDRYGRSLSEEDGRQIIQTISEFFALLSEWDEQKNKKISAE